MISLLIASLRHARTEDRLQIRALSVDLYIVAVGWKYEGPLCIGEQRTIDGHDTGAMWECPFLVAPATESSRPESDSQQASTSSLARDGSEMSNGATSSIRPDPEGGNDHAMCVSPYPHNGSGTNPCLYWLGQYHDGRFDLENACGACTVCCTLLAH